MIVQSVKKEMLESMKVGEQKVFTLPTARKARSGQSYANQMKRLTAGTDEPREYSASFGDTLPDGTTTLIVTRLV